MWYRKQQTIEKKYKVYFSKVGQKNKQALSLKSAINREPQNYLFYRWINRQRKVLLFYPSTELSSYQRILQSQGPTVQYRESKRSNDLSPSNWNPSMREYINVMDK